MRLSDVRKHLRRKIVPMENIFSLLSGLDFKSVLDVGAGTGLFLEEMRARRPQLRMVGVETNNRYCRADTGICIVGPEALTEKEKFDLILFMDVLHHNYDKATLLNYYISRHLADKGHVFIKEMSPEKQLCKYYNRLHDLLMFQERIYEISLSTLVEFLQPKLRLVSHTSRRIFLYDHYMVLLQSA